MTILKEEKLVQVQCPNCKLKKKISVPNAVISQASQLTTLSVPSGIVCDHHFQVFIDKNYKVRGYQKVDFEIKENLIKADNAKEKSETSLKDDEELFKNLILEGNYLEYIPSKNIVKKPSQLLKEVPPRNEEKENLRELYEEFWEFIDDDNREFQEFIVKDKRRKKLN